MMSPQVTISRLLSENATLRRRIAELEAECRAAPAVPSSSSRSAVARKHAGEALQQSQAHLETILDNLTEGVVAADLQGNLLQWNRAALEMHGCASPADCPHSLPALAETFEFSDLDGTVLPLEQWPLARVLRGERVHDLEICIRRIDVQWERIFNFGGNLVRDAAGRPRMAVLTIRDISARKRAEEALRNSQHDLNHAQAVARTGSWRLNVRRNELLWSDETHRLFGIPKETPLTYEAFLAAIHPDDRAYVDQKWTAALGGAPYDIEHRILVAGEVKWVRERAVLEFDEEGALLGGFGTVQDITERKHAEDELRKSREWLRVTLNSIGDAVMTTDAAGQVTFLNPVAVALTGWSLKEAKGVPIQRVFQIVNEKTLQPAEDIVGRVLHEGRTFELANHTALITKDGQQIPIEDSAAPIRDSEGNISGVVLVFHEVTEKRRAEDALAKAKAAAEEANRAKDHFLAVLGHELRNPLAPIRNSVALLNRLGPQDPTVHRASEIIDRQVRQMTRLIDDLLDVSRIASGKITLRNEELDLAAVVQSAVEDHRPLLEANGLTLRFEASREPVMVFGDAARIIQIVGNFLTNAGKFTDRGGQVDVRVANEGDHASIRVCDSGIGMDAATLARLFRPFAQGEHGFERNQGGLGLGLALVQGLSELHGGRVQASSAGPGRGSEFALILPRLMQVAAPKPQESQPPGRALQPQHILVIEDNEDAAETLRMLLELSGHSVEVAHTGPEGLARACALTPDIVLCDIGLPGGMSGYEVAQAMRRRPELRSACLVAMTGYGQEEDRKQAREAGFDHHLTKPADPEALERLLASSGR
jgi:PAS domain S-box-containing protein